MNDGVTWPWQVRIQPGWIAGLTLLSLAGPAQKGLAADESDSDSDFAAPIRPFLEEYCLRCHGGDEIEGGVDLRGLTSERDLAVHRELWESVIEQVDSEEMPSKGPLPDGDERGQFLDWVRASLEAVDWSDYRDPGRVTLPRLTRTEYRNTLRDLLGVDLKAGEFLAQDGEGQSGFANDRDSLSMTPAQLEQYFVSAERAIDGVFGLAKPPMEFSINAEAMERSPEKLKPFEHGVVIVHPDHELRADVVFPVDGWYAFQIDAAVFGGKPCVADFRIDGERVASVSVTSDDYRGSPSAKTSGFVRAGRHVVTVQSRNLVPQTPEPPDIVRVIDELARKKAPRLGALSEGESPEVAEIREGLNTKAWGIQESIEWLRFLGPKGDSRKIDLRRVYLEERQGDWNTIRDNLASAAGLPVPEIDRRWKIQNRDRLTDNALVLSSVAAVKWEDWMAYQGKLFVNRLAIVGPVRTKSVMAGNWNLVDALAAPDANPERLIRELLPRAFRRPVSADEGDRYVELLRDAQVREALREDALSIALTAVLTSPHFLYRKEAGEGALDSFAIASRLSFFLWQSMPDAELFDLAEAGLLIDPSIIESQADRMLDDPRAAAFFESFSNDWLGIRELGRGIAPERSRFPEFDSNLANAMKAEAHHFLGWWFRENRSIGDLVDSRVTFLNGRLARHYGIGGVDGEAFRQVAVDETSHRGGVLGLGSVLVVTSSPARTNPVRRGAWILERLLGDDPGEALPTAGELPGNAGEARGLTLREELELHRTQAECARCHERIDPLGFGLQNFDATGRWRDSEAGRPVDANGVLVDGSEFNGPTELKRLLEEKYARPISENLVRRLLAFALGRELQYFDTPLVEEIVASLEPSGGTSRDLIREIVTSDAFRTQGKGAKGQGGK